MDRGYLPLQYFSNASSTIDFKENRMFKKLKANPKTPGRALLALAAVMITAGIERMLKS